MMTRKLTNYVCCWLEWRRGVLLLKYTRISVNVLQVIVFFCFFFAFYEVCEAAMHALRRKNIA